MSTIRLNCMFLMAFLGSSCGGKTGLAIPEVDRVEQPATPTEDAAVSLPPPPVLDAGLPEDASADADVVEPEDAGMPDAGPRPCRIPAPVDLLLVVDDSGSMWEEQNTLADQLPRLVADLAQPPDQDGDGSADWRGIQDLHLGVVTTGIEPLCSGVDDGILRNRATPELGECRQDLPRFLTYRHDRDEPDLVSADFACVARAGTRGCALEQPLEAAIKALLPQDSTVGGFLAGRGRGDQENAGFLRADSMLAVVILADEDDCSVSSAVFPPREPEDLPECLGEADPLFPIERYVEAFESLRPDRPDLFTLAVIGGVPARLVPDPTDVDFETILDDPFMVNRLDRRAIFPRLVPACEGRWGQAAPARRLIQVAREFGEQAAVASICERSYTPIVEAIARHVGTRACDEFE